MEDRIITNINVSGMIVGYDPGGNGAHGLALASYNDGKIQGVRISTHPTVQSIISTISEFNDVIAIGIDTLTCWSTGPSGWRPADRWLKNEYPEITNSIASANSLFGSMGLNGMSALLKIKESFPNIHISETHPKVMYFELAKKKYNYKECNKEMDSFLSDLIGINISTKNDHEWDAAASIYAVYCGATGKWVNNLHSKSVTNNEVFVEPCGPTSYWWPK